MLPPRPPLGGPPSARPPRALPPHRSPPSSRGPKRSSSASGLRSSEAITAALGRSLSATELSCPGSPLFGKLNPLPPIGDALAKKPLVGTTANEATQKVVYERMTTLLANLQRQYADKLDALIQQAQGAAEDMLLSESGAIRAPIGNAGVLPADADDGAHPAVPHASLDAIVGSLVVASPAVRSFNRPCTPKPFAGGGEESEPSEHPGPSSDDDDDALSEDLPPDAAGASKLRPLGPSACSTAATSETGQADCRPVAATAGGTEPPAAASAPTRTKPKKDARAAKGPSKRGKKVAKARDGITCPKTVQFEGCTAVRCAISMKDEVWTADWSGNLCIRDREDVEKVKEELPSTGLVWCMVLVRARFPMIWVGQERAGIPVFHAHTRQLLCTLTGGHSGNVVSFATADGPDGRVDVYSAGNDFSIRCWHIEPGKLGKVCPAGATALPCTPPFFVRRGVASYGHSNSVRCLLRIGPVLWSGSDDKSIRIWQSSYMEVREIIENAHEAGVLALVVAGRGVWSTGYDGRVKEWSISGATRQCTREMCLNEPVKALLPIGKHIWICGKSKHIAVYSQEMEQVDTLDGHNSFVSSLCLVDRVETRTIWSSSLGDHSLKVWRHVLRGDDASVMELAASNKMYEEQHWESDQKLEAAEAAIGAAKAELAAASLEFAAKLDEALNRVAQAEQAQSATMQESQEALNAMAAAERAEQQALGRSLSLQAELDAAVAARHLAEAKASDDAAASASAEAAKQQAMQALAAARQDAADLSLKLTDERSRVDLLQQELACARSSIESEAAGSATLAERLRASEAETRRALEALAAECDRSSALEMQLQVMTDQAAAIERERNEACAREKQLESRYAELDVFKLDIIARELKSIDRQIDGMRAEARAFLEAAKKFNSFNDQQAGTKSASFLSDTSTKLRGHIRDVIDRCLSETQKLHVGAPLADPTAAGVLKDGGKMAGFVAVEGGEGVPPPARIVGGPPSTPLVTHPRQQDELRRERRQPSPDVIGQA